ncbi:esterase-like activity of phytase family protein [Tropicimonas sp. IMCC34011]|uniref:esterase-like activity of phytase family protein n=1 Tax=Tropicimonas sp. IMCC34011 TaxID=2248759 RepID=UPI000E229D44|nr:esterase-like activity of phytase family protein [Tropicimonas sp. IMCC34011]
MRASPLRALILALVALASCVAADEAVAPEAAAVVAFPEPDPGGWSAVHVSPDGARAIAIADNGVRADLRLRRENGRLTGADLISRAPLAGPDGRTLEGAGEDSEGLALLPDGRVAISFERASRILIYPADGGSPERLAVPEAETLDPNRGYEGLASSPDGTLYTLREGNVDDTGPVPLWAWDGAWRVSRQIPRDRAWLAAGADIGPDGQIYILERAFLGLGFASRIRRFNTTGDDSGQIVWSSSFGVHGNLEGLSLWQDGATLRALMVSDNNHAGVARSEFVEIVLPRDLR